MNPKLEQTVATTPVATPLPQEISPQKTVRRKVFIIAFTVVFITLAVSATIILDSKDFPFVQKFFSSFGGTTVQDQTNHVLESLFSIKTADVDVALTTSGPMFVSEKPVNSHFTGSFDPKGGENGSFTFSYNITNGGGALFVPTTFSLINVGADSYFQANGLPNVFLISDALNGRWINVSQNVQNAGFVYPTFNKNAVLKDFEDAHVFSDAENLGSETVSGMPAVHYKLKVNQENFEAFLPMLAKEMQLSVSEENMQKIAQAIAMNNLEVWVGVKDFFPYKILLELTTKKDEQVHISDGTLSATIIFSKLNEAKQIAAPKDAVTLPAALTPKLQGFVGGLFDKALGMIFQQFPHIDGLPDSDGDGVNDASEIVLGTDPKKKDTNNNGVSNKEELSAKLGDSRDVDHDGLSDSVETLFGTDPNKADSDGDGFKDGDEVINGFNPKGPGKLFP